jgi:hypothetical protein
MGIKEIIREVVDCRVIQGDSDKWRALVTTVMKLESHKRRLISSLVERLTTFQDSLHRGVTSVLTNREQQLDCEHSLI